MVLYVVLKFDSTYKSTLLEGIFSTEEKAREAVDKYYERSDDVGYSVAKRELDAVFAS